VQKLTPAGLLLQFSGELLGVLITAHLKVSPPQRQLSSDGGSGLQGHYGLGVLPLGEKLQALFGLRVLGEALGKEEEDKEKGREFKKTLRAHNTPVPHLILEDLSGKVNERKPGDTPSFPNPKEASLFSRALQAPRRIAFYF